jgi:hypothetical protein
VNLHRGHCNRSKTPSGREFVSPPTGALGYINFGMRSMDLFKSTCLSAFSEFPGNWQQGYCAEIEGHMCNLDGPQVVRFVLTAGGPAVSPISFSVDGHAVSFSEYKAPAESSGGGVYMSERSSLEAVLALGQGCHALLVVFEDGASTTLDQQVRILFPLFMC